MVKILDGNNAVIARTEFDLSYDGSIALSVAGATNHDDLKLRLFLYRTRKSFSNYALHERCRGVGPISRSFTYDTLGNVTSASGGLLPDAILYLQQLKPVRLPCQRVKGFISHHSHNRPSRSARDMVYTTYLRHRYTLGRRIFERFEHPSLQIRSIPDH